jgi:hypothetical protein
MVAMSVRMASPAMARASRDRLAAAWSPAPQASVTTTGTRPWSAPCRTVGSIPTFSSVGSVMCLVKKTLSPARRAASSTCPRTPLPGTQLTRARDAAVPAGGRASLRLRRERSASAMNMKIVAVSR